MELSSITAMDHDQLLSTLTSRLPASSDKPSVIFVCHHGNDSQVAAKHCSNLLGEAIDIFDLTGGLECYSTQVDNNFPRY